MAPFFALHFPAGMLKITLFESPGELRLGLEGSLSGPWAGELRRCWRDALATSRFRRTVVDLREVDFVDGEGESALGGNAPRRRAVGGADARDSRRGAGDFARGPVWYG